MKKLESHSLFIPILLLAVSLVSYGLLVVRPGFFGDDLSILWLYKRSGLSGLMSFYEYSQPLTALFITPFLEIIGEQAWIYQFSALLLRWLGAWAFWILIRSIWPKNNGKAVVAALFFLVFPGFKQIPVAISMLPHLTALCLTLVSFLLIYNGTKSPRFRGIKLGGAWLASISLFISPYFIGLEFLRPGLIWMGWKKEVLFERGISREITNVELLRKTILTWLPYAFSLILRFLITGLSGQGVTESNVSILTAAGLIKTILRDLVNILFLVWRQIFKIPENSNQIFIYLLIVFAMACLVYIVIKGFERNDVVREINGPDEGKNWQMDFLLVGLAAVLAGGLPIWLGHEQVGLSYPVSVVMLAFLPGAALLITGLINLILLNQFQSGLAALLIGLSTGVHIQNSIDFASEWNRVDRIVQQFSRRIPAMKEGTTLVSEQLPLNYYSEANLTGLLNIVYFPERKGNLDGLQYLNAGFGENNVISEASEGKSIIIAKQGFHFSGSTSQLTAFYVPEKGCVRVLQLGGVDLSSLPSNLGMAVAISNPEKIIRTELENNSLPRFFSKDNDSDRCNLLQQIELAEQIGDWQEAARISDKELQILRKVDHPYELVPVIEAFAHNGDSELTRELSLEAAGNGSAPYELCRFFERINRAGNVTVEVKTVVSELSSKDFCKKYD